MSNIRFKFLRGEEVKYISHLDLMKVFERAARRAGIPIAYSQGFNPHPQMVFGLPLSVGVTSEAEYADFELSGDIALEEFCTCLNDALPGGLQILKADFRLQKSNIMASISRASYCILVATAKKVGFSLINEKLKELLQKPSIMVKKETKKGIRDMDIRPMIHFAAAMSIGDKTDDFENVCLNPYITDYAGNVSIIGERAYDGESDLLYCLSVQLSAGSAANLKPEYLVAALKEGADFEIDILKIHRTGLFVERDEYIYEPLDAKIL